MHEYKEFYLKNDFNLCTVPWRLEGGEGCLSRQGGSLLIGFFHQISGNTLSTKRIILLLFISFVSDISAKPVLQTKKQIEALQTYHIRKLIKEDKLFSLFLKNTKYPWVLYEKIQELCKQITYLALTNNRFFLTASVSTEMHLHGMYVYVCTLFVTMGLEYL